MTEQEAFDRLEYIKLKQQGMDRDPEEDHAMADKVLCDLLCHLGYGQVVILWRDIDKWYA